MVDKLPDIRVFGRESAWDNAWFPAMFVGGLERDGLESRLAGVLLDIFSALKPESITALQQAVTESTVIDDADKAALGAALERTQRQAEFNARCYARSSPEDERVVAWPNNPRTKAADPDFYFDIFEDLPYRDVYPILTSATPIGSAGSCFALRIAHQLQSWGYNYVIEEDDLPPGFPVDRLASTSYRMAPARMGTLFNVPSMRQMVERAFGVMQPEKILVQDDRRLVDPFRSIQPLYNDLAGFSGDYQQHNEALRRALLKCEVFVLTLGLTEAWRFAHSGEYASLSPWRIDPSLLRPHQLSVAENVAELERLFEVYTKFRPGIKLIVSVSPVPLNKTFSTSQHVVAANALSKATLRVAADEFCRNHSGQAFYFPSYEVVMSCTREPWESDMRHVSPAAVGRVMKLFRRMFFVDQSHAVPVLHHDVVDTSPDVMTLAKGRAKKLLRKLGLR